jgi:tRNA (guanine-N7-)-methyltransferase
MMRAAPEANLARIAWDLKRRTVKRYEQFWTERNLEIIPRSLFASENKDRPIWLEIGAGSGWFFTEMAHLHPEPFFIAIERSRERGKRLERKTQRAGLPNLAGFRANAIPALIDIIPTESCDRVYLLYPCPWPRNSQRKNRWYLHPIMPHLYRILKPGGILVWASDQRFYIDEARFVCEQIYQLETLVHGELVANAYNDLANFAGGRTKFEASFLAQGLPCHELISRKADLKS